MGPEGKVAVGIDGALFEVTDVDAVGEGEAVVALALRAVKA